MEGLTSKKIFSFSKLHIVLQVNNMKLRYNNKNCITFTISSEKKNSQPQNDSLLLANGESLTGARNTILTISCICEDFDDSGFTFLVLRKSEDEPFLPCLRRGLLSARILIIVESSKYEPKDKLLSDKSQSHLD